MPKFRTASITRCSATAAFSTSPPAFSIRLSIVSIFARSSGDACSLASKLAGPSNDPSMSATRSGMGSDCSVNSVPHVSNCISRSTQRTLNGVALLKRHPRRVRVLLSLLTTGLLWAALETGFPRLVRFMPLSLQRNLPPAVGLLAQSSKRGLIPRDYTALLGDSYAEGDGDWHLSVDGRSNPPYHSAQLLRDGGLGDVVSFGLSGAGSLSGIVQAPLGFEAYLDALGRFAPIGPPRRALIYFYEGNDLNDNLRDLRARFLPRFDANQLFDERYFHRFIESLVAEDPLVQQARSMSWRTRFLSGPFIWAASRQALGLGPAPIPDPNLALRIPAGQAVNRARVGKELVELPDRLQGPALELTDEEFRVSQWMFQQAVVFATRHWPATQFVIVLLPSPLSCYALEGERVSAQSYEGRGQIFPLPMVRKNSDRIADELRRVAGAAGLGFVDARPELTAGAAKRLIHGPRDWKHFNRSGYEALARAILAGLSRPKPMRPLS